MPGIVVVGVDGSEDSSAALRWALRYAGEHDAVARVVHVWTPLSADRARSTEDVVTRTELALPEVRPLPTRVEAVVVEGAPGAALVELSRDALILVVGATGQGSVAGGPWARIGSTARHVTRHACCPVTVIGRHPRPVTGAGVLPVRTVPVRMPVVSSRVSSTVGR